MSQQTYYDPQGRPIVTTVTPPAVVPGAGVRILPPGCSASACVQSAPYYPYPQMRPHLIMNQPPTTVVIEQRPVIAGYGSYGYGYGGYGPGYGVGGPFMAGAAAGAVGTLAGVELMDLALQGGGHPGCGWGGPQEFGPGFGPGFGVDFGMGGFGW